MKRILVITGPSGIGKSYLARELTKKYPLHIEEAKLFTTRKPRSGEVSPDRIFIQPKEFDSMNQANEFAITGVFHGNHYGYRKQDLAPKDKHIVVNTWPALLTKFELIPNVQIIALTIKSNRISLLTNRMRERGDTEQTIKQRLPLIRQDLHDLSELEPTLRQRTTFFLVESDHTIPEHVLPWIEKTALSDKIGI